MSHSGLIPEAHLLLIQNDRVLLLRRQNTGYEDGNYGLIAGHVEAGETPRQGMVREAAEEAGLTLEPKNLILCHVMHRQASDGRVAFFFRTARWTNEPRNLEPDKCSDLSWFPLDALPANMMPYVRDAIGLVQRGVLYSEDGRV